VCATIDFETRSGFGIKRGGAWGYAEHSSTEVLCLAVRMPDGYSFLWHPHLPGLPEEGATDLHRFFEYVKSGGLIEAHNVQFERAIWEFVCVKRMGWPEVKPEQWRCSAAIAASHSLPRALGKAAAALGTSDQKDKTGTALIRKLCIPRSPLKADCELVAEHLLGDKTQWRSVVKTKDMLTFIERYAGVPGVKDLRPYREDVEDLKALFKYCKQDVAAEHAISQTLGPLTDEELRVWQLDLEMNSHGVRIDLDLARSAVAIAEHCTELADAEMSRLTDGAVERCGQRDKLLAWINARGESVLPNAQKAVLEHALHDPAWSDLTREVIQLRLDQAKVSVKKYEAMLRVANSDGRARGLLSYYGADTGRWSGRLIQPQNFPRGTAPGSMEDLCDVVLTGDVDYIELMYGGVMEALSSALRGAIIADEGHDLIVSDYSSIEARGLFWLTDDMDALRLLRGGSDIYIEMAAQIFHVATSAVTKYQRQVGKQAILGLGYQMGWVTFQARCADVGIELTDEFSQQVVRTYRSVHHMVRQFWYRIEEAAIEAVRSKQPVTFGKLQMCVTGDFLCIYLPSGRPIKYHLPQVNWVLSKFQDDSMEELYKEARAEGWPVEKCDAHGLNTKWQLSYMGVDTYTRKYERCYTYGGKLTENVVQGLSRDIMAEAMLRLNEYDEYFPILTVHDEVISKVKVGVGSVDEYEQLLTVVPEWAKGFPVAASDGWRGKRYHK